MMMELLAARGSQGSCRRKDRGFWPVRWRCAGVCLALLAVIIITM